MARKNKVSTPKLPSHIELVSSKTGQVREFETSHAQSILNLQTKSGMGNFELYNTQLYKIDGQTGAISTKEQPSSDEHIPDQGGEDS
jgi:hypothetical protein